MIRAALILPALLMLPACAWFEDKDPREGVETVEACLERLGGEASAEDFEMTDAEGVLVIPTYTYDITKMSLDDIKDLIVEGSDETAGSRGMVSTNETSTAVAQFMEEPVDDKGAFFMGLDPALYRVRGEPVAIDQIVATGCARQVAGMRLTAFNGAVQGGGTQSTDTSPENENDS